MNYVPALWEISHSVIIYWSSTLCYKLVSNHSVLKANIDQEYLSPEHWQWCEIIIALSTDWTKCRRHGPLFSLGLNHPVILPCEHTWIFSLVIAWGSLALVAALQHLKWVSNKCFCCWFVLSITCKRKVIKLQRACTLKTCILASAEIAKICFHFRCCALR